ncbi:Hypothetical predicted protein, partial [Octopus vulgaris]
VVSHVSTVNNNNDNSHNSTNTNNANINNNNKSNNSSRSTANQSPPTLLLKVETDFRPVASQTSLTMCVKNYDGTETHKTILQDERQETVKEVTVSQDAAAVVAVVLYHIVLHVIMSH